MFGSNWNNSPRRSSSGWGQNNGMGWGQQRQNPWARFGAQYGRPQQPAAQAPQMGAMQQQQPQMGSPTQGVQMPQMMPQPSGMNQMSQYPQMGGMGQFGMMPQPTSQGSVSPGMSSVGGIRPMPSGMMPPMPQSGAISQMGGFGPMPPGMMPPPPGTYAPTASTGWGDTFTGGTAAQNPFGSMLSFFKSPLAGGA